jgi:S1-C subfamily serine protease
VLGLSTHLLQGAPQWASCANDELDDRSSELEWTLARRSVQAHTNALKHSTNQSRLACNDSPLLTGLDGSGGQAMSGQWFVMGRDEIHGPYSKEHLLRLIEAGRIKPITQVRQGNVGPWRLASKVPGLFTPESKPQTAVTATRLPRPLVLGLIVGGAIIGTSVLTAVLCIALLRPPTAAPVESVGPPAPAIVAAEIESEPPVDGDEPSPANAATVEPRPESLPVPVVADRPPASPIAVAEQPKVADPPATPVPAIQLDPKPILPPVPVEKTAIENSKIVEFNKAVRLELKGKDAYARYLVFSQSFAFTEKHFRTVLQRSPNNAAALNSLAISQLKQREFGVAFTSFARSAELTPNCQEVAHNLGRAVMLAEQGRLPIEPGQLRRFTDLYSQLIADERAKAYEEHTGWLHMLPVFPADERKDEQPKQPQNPDLVVAFWGSGFVVAPDMVATNRHVVHEADGRGVVDVVGIIDPDDPAHKRELRGTVTAVSDTTDLAFVKFSGLKLPPLEIVALPAKQAEEVMILGFPRSDLFGTTIKSTRGVISALPDANRAVFPEFYLFDAISDHGNSGGPIIDRSGSVIAVLTAGLGLKARVAFDLEAEFTAGVPGSQLDTFANQHIADRKSPTPPEGGLVLNEWAEVVAKATPSVVHLTCYYNAGLAGLNLAGNQQKKTSGAWEDYTCPFCSGNSRVACPGRGCISGRVSVPYYVDEVVGAGMDRQVIRHKKFRKERCGTCDGAGTLDCRGCINGVDKFLR